MTGTRITFDARFDDSAADARLAELVGRMDDLGGFLRPVAEHLLNSTRDRFAAEKGPDGTPWARLRPATIRERERKKLTPIQILTRHTRSGLRASINAQVGQGEVRIGTPKIYGAIHQLGGKISRPARDGVIYRHVSWKSQKLDPRFASKKKANVVQKVERKAYEISMPARPFLGISKGDQEAIINIAADWLRA